jgi:hypothetical protein
MGFSHRDHRARRELRELYLGFGASLGALSFLAIVFPNVMVRQLAVVGLAVAGTLYVVAVDRLSDRYRRDLTAVRAGAPISGSVRAEVYDEIGFERDREDDWRPSPLRRRPELGREPPGPPGTDSTPATTSSPRSDLPSDGS